MATKTTNYGLTKPDQTDTYNIADFNTDMDTIDAALKKAIDTNIMSGATASQDGTQGLTPAPVHGQQNYVLTGAGAFKDLLSLLTAFVGATASAAGTMGAVPAPAAGQQANLLTGAGTFQSIASILTPLSLQNGAIYSCDFSNAPTSWWAKLGGAGVLIVQGGRVSSPSSTGNATVVTFPLAFPSAAFGALVTLNSSDRLIVTKTNLTQTGMNVNFFWSDGGNVSIASSADYIAVGN